jgi:hypothetical protein
MNNELFTVKWIMWFLLFFQISIEKIFSKQYSNAFLMDFLGGTCCILIYFFPWKHTFSQRFSISLKAIHKNIYDLILWFVNQSINLLVKPLFKYYKYLDDSACIRLNSYSMGHSSKIGDDDKSFEYVEILNGM